MSRVPSCVHMKLPAMDTYGSRGFYPESQVYFLITCLFMLLLEG